MKSRYLCGLTALIVCTLLLNGCGTTAPSTAPPVTAAFVRAGIPQGADAPTLATGRSLFLSRCIQCHALPEVSRFNSRRLTAIVAKMSGRANMNAEQQEALLKYLLTVRSL